MEYVQLIQTRDGRRFDRLEAAQRHVAAEIGSLVARAANMVSNIDHSRTRTFELMQDDAFAEIITEIQAWKADMVLDEDEDEEMAL